VVREWRCRFAGEPMRIAVWIVIFVAGIALGVVMGGMLMQRIGERFVHYERGPLKYGAVFLGAPRPHGQWLCRLSRYDIAARIVNPSDPRPQNDWQDDVSITPTYGIWKRPTQVELPGYTREVACAAYQDVENVFTEDDANRTVSLELRAVYVLDAAIEAARRGTATFPVTCVDHRRNGAACDGKAVLKAIELKQLRHVTNVSETTGRTDGTARSDELAFPVVGDSGGDHPEVMLVVIDSFQHYGRHSAAEGAPTGVHIRYIAM
jgi:hypothetical protein